MREAPKGTSQHETINAPSLLIVPGDIDEEWGMIMVETEAEAFRWR